MNEHFLLKIQTDSTISILSCGPDELTQAIHTELGEGIKEVIYEETAPSLLFLSKTQVLDDDDINECVTDLFNYADTGNVFYGDVLAGKLTRDESGYVLTGFTQDEINDAINTIKSQ